MRRFRARAAVTTVFTLLLSGLFAVGFGAGVAVAATTPAGFTDTLVAKIPSPTGIAFTTDGRMLVSSQPGTIRVIKNGALLATPALNLAGRICTNSERGVLGVAADPDPATKAIFVFYTSRGTSASCPYGPPVTTASPRNRVSRFVLGDNNIVNPASETILLDGIYATAGYHNAGDLKVGKDGYLYISTGDGGCDYAGNSGCGGENDASRDRNILNGKILRITKTGGIPTANPFRGADSARCNKAPAAAGKTCQEAFAIGLRNPFRMAFNPNATNTSFRINDVGQNVWEEINQGIKGADYGWPVREGHCAQTGVETNCGPAKPAAYTNPVYDYGHSTGCGSITGGAYVPNGVWPAAYNGSYLFADYVCGKIFTLTGTTRTDFVTGLGASSAVALAFGPDGSSQSLYYTNYTATPSKGEVRKITYTGTANRAPTAAVTATPPAGDAPLAVTFSAASSTDPDGDTLTYAWNFGDGTTGTGVRPTHTYTANRNYTVTLTVKDPAGLTGSASTVVSVGNTAPVVTITAPTASQQFTVGAHYTLRGTATDSEDGTLPASSMSWTVLRHHAEHTHPLYGPVTGNNLAFDGPAPEDLAAAANSYVEIILTATDSDGVSTTVRQDFNPVTVPVTFATDPAGLKVTVNGTAVTGPTAITSWAGYPVTVAAAAQTGPSGQAYVFSRWSDSGAASHQYVTPTPNGTAVRLTATFAATNSVPPSAPGTFTAKASGTTATMTWVPPTTTGGSAITGYRVARDGIDGAGNGAYSKVIAANLRTFTMTNLVAGRTYNLSVQAVTAGGTSPVIGASVVMNTTSTPAPTSITISEPSTSSAKIDWLPPTGVTATSYTVTRDGTDSTGAGAYSTQVSAGTRSFTMTRLVPGQTYTLTVRANTAAGPGAVARAGVLMG